MKRVGFFVFLSCLLAVSAFCQQGARTRGIGVYPGDPSEYFGPRLVAGGSELRNVALFRAARHSSSIDNDHTAQLVSDGVVRAEHVYSWKSAGSQNEWIELDLGGEASLERMVFHWVNAPVSVRIQVSADGTTWNEVNENENQNENENGGAKQTVTLPACRGRYVRALLDSTADGNPFELAEWEVFGRGGVVTVAAAAPVRKGQKQLLNGGQWKLRRATEVEAPGEALSLATYDDSAWMTATVPGTVLGSYVNAGAVLHPNFADNQFFISDAYFYQDFWYRDCFEAHPDTPRQFLHFCGVNFKAEVYLNGRRVGDIVGAFHEKDLDVTGILKEGTNCLAVKIIRNNHYGTVKEQDAFSPGRNGGVVGADNPTMHAANGWDWLPTVRGRNIGIYDEVYVRYTGPVTVEEPFVRTELPLPDTTSARIMAQARLVNHSDQPVTGILKGRFGKMKFQQEATLAPGESRIVECMPLTMNHPQLWWPNGYGAQHLYDVQLSFETGKTVSDACSFKTGVRQITYQLYPYTPVSQCRMKGRDNNQRLDIYVNGRRIIGFGGNWGFPEHLLNYRAREYDIAVGYHADQHFDMIRNWVGMTGNRAFYEACDRHGIIIWQDFWLANPADGPNPEDPERFRQTAREYVRLIRNHPSVGFYVGRNEGYPPEELDSALAEIVSQEHPGHQYISHSGADGVSGGGPYRALPTKDYFNMFGADKLHSERGMPTVMNYENLYRTMGKDYIEPVSTMAHPNLVYGLHDWSLGTSKVWCAQVTESFNEMLAKAFGEPADAHEFAQLSQWINYDGYRAMFEGRSEHRRGVLLWMSHPAWPSLVWETYDYYFEPTAAYFGCKKACEPLHILYNPVHGSIEVVNYHAGNHERLTANAQILNMEGKAVWSNTCPLDIREDETKSCFPLQVPEDITDVYFIKLSLQDARGKVLSDNFYWQGKEEGNLKALKTLPKVPVKMKVKQKGTKFVVILTNAGQVPALMLRLKVVDQKSGDLVLPVWYSDNYISLMPGESRSITVSVRAEDCDRPVMEVEGVNVEH